MNALNQILSANAGMHLGGHFVARLLLAVFLGGAIGLEREIRHKPAGLRTQLRLVEASGIRLALDLAVDTRLGL